MDSPVVVPSITDELARRSWTREAACASGAQSDQSWVIATSYGRESALTVVECFAVCAACPVRTSCLADAVNESSWSVMGVWGGSVMSERTRAVKAARRQDPDATEAEIRERAAAELESSFQARLAIWEHMARHGAARRGRPPTKRTVAVGVAWT